MQPPCFLARWPGCCQQGCKHGTRLVLQDLRPVKLYNLRGGERRGGARDTAELSLEGPEAPLSARPPPAPGAAPTFPSLMTRMRSQLRMVETRCAMTRTVQPRKASEIVRWIRASVSRSMEAVASSMMMIWEETKQEWGRPPWALSLGPVLGPPLSKQVP